MCKKVIQIFTIIIFCLILLLLSIPKKFEGIYVSKDFPGQKFCFYEDGSFLADSGGYYSLYQEHGYTFLRLTDMSGESKNESSSVYNVQASKDTILLFPFSSYYFEGNGNDVAVRLELIYGEDGLRYSSGYFSSSYRLDSDNGSNVSIAFYKDGSFTLWIPGYYKMAGNQITMFLSDNSYTVIPDTNNQTFILLSPDT